MTFQPVPASRRRLLRRVITTSPTGASQASDNRTDGPPDAERGRVAGALVKEAGRHELTDYFMGDPSAVSELCRALSN